MINDKGTVLAPTFGGGANSLVTEMLGDDAIISSDFGGNPPYEKMKEVARICFKHWLKQANVLFIIGGKSNNTDIFETLRAMADALREHFSAHGPTPLYVVVGRGGPNLVRGMGALRDTCDALGLPYRLFGFDSDMSEVIQFAKKVDAWMKAGGREQVAARLGIDAPAAASASLRRHASCKATWQKQGVGDFKYYVGISSLTQVAIARRPRLRAQHPRRRVERRDAGEPRLLGRQRRLRHCAGQGRRGARDAASATSPSTTTCATALAAGHRFNCGVVYLPPSAARDGVAELIRVNPELRKIFIITEKIAVHDAREIRAMGQQNGIDIFGANGLGVADSWNQVRIGGALGGDKPGRLAAPGLDRDLLQLGRLLDHHRAVPAHGRLGHDDRRSRAARTSTSTTRRPSSPSRWPTTRAARRRCSTASRAATTSSTPTSRSRWSPAWSAAGRAS